MLQEGERVLQAKVTALSERCGSMGEGKKVAVSCSDTMIISRARRQIGATYDLRQEAVCVCECVCVCACVCVLRTLTLKVSIVPSSSWTRQSRSGFGMSVTTVTLPPSQDKHPALSSSLRGDLETHTNTHTHNHKNSVRCFQTVVFQWKRLPQDDIVWWVIYVLDGASGCSE